MTIKPIIPTAVSTGNVEADSDIASDLEHRFNQALNRLAELEDMERNYRSTLENLYLHQEELRTQNDELRHAQVSLENARRRHQDLFDFSPVAQFLVSPNGMILKTNRVAGGLLGLGSSDLHNYHMPNLAGSSSHRVSILSFLADVAAHNTPAPITVDLFRRDGRSVRVQLHGSRSGAHQETSILITAVDNSRSAEMEQERALRIESEQLYETLMARCNRRVFVTDSGWRIRKVNTEFCKSTGYQSQELHGQKLETFVFSLASDAANWQVWQTLQNNGVWIGETLIRDKQGATLAAVLDINAIRDEQGGIQAYIGVF